MTTHLMAKSTRALLTLSALGGALVLTPAWSQQFPITPAQRATATQVAAKGVPLADLAPNAPDRYTIKSGDTLWAISHMYLKSPWRWPELWGMNLNDIQNPHRIYPGQVLILERGPNGATLRLRDGDGMSAMDGAPGGTVRLSPHTRVSALNGGPLPTLNPAVIEPFLAEPLIVDVAEYENAPRIVAGRAGRLMLSSGDRAYAQGPTNAPILDDQQTLKKFRIYGTAKPLKSLDTGALLGYEAAYVGTATLAKGEERPVAMDEKGKPIESVVAAAIDITSAKQEARIGNRLLPVQGLQIQTYAPHAPTAPVRSRIISVYGDAVANAAQNQVVAISSGANEGVDVGTVLAILKNGQELPKRDGENGPTVRLPDERIGLLMVFRTFEHLSYGLILEIVDGVAVGDRLVSPD